MIGGHDSALVNKNNRAPFPVSSKDLVPLSDDRVFSSRKRVRQKKKTIWIPSDKKRKASVLKGFKGNFSKDVLPGSSSLTKRELISSHL